MQKTKTNSAVKNQRRSTVKWTAGRLGVLANEYAKFRFTNFPENQFAKDFVAEVENGEHPIFTEGNNQFIPTEHSIISQLGIFRQQENRVFEKISKKNYRFYPERLETLTIEQKKLEAKRYQIKERLEKVLEGIPENISTEILDFAMDPTMHNAIQKAKICSDLIVNGYTSQAMEFANIYLS